MFIAGNARARALIVRPGHVGMLLAQPAITAAARAIFTRPEVGEAYAL
jgi:hypothetical protein